MFKIIQYATMWSLLTQQRWAGPPSLSATPGRSHRTPVPRLAPAPCTMPRGSARPPPRPLPRERQEPQPRISRKPPRPHTLLKTKAATPAASTALVYRRDDPCVNDGAAVTVIVALPQRGRETRDRVREAGSRQNAIGGDNVGSLLRLRRVWTWRLG